MTKPKRRGLAGAFLLAAAAALAVLGGSIRAQSTDESRTYEAIKLRDMLTFDFMLAHPEGKEAEGVTPEEAEVILKTITHGADRVAAAQSPTGIIITHTSYNHIAGSHALATWTLLACGRASTDPVVVKAVDAMLRLVERRLPPPEPEAGKPPVAKGKDGAEGLYTYDASIVLLALHALAESRRAEAEKAEIQEEIKKGRTPKPKEIQTTRTAADFKAEATALGALLKPAEAKAAKALFDTLTKRQAADGQWTYTDTPGATGDSSNTHFAMLGLLSAFRLGVGKPSGFQLDRTERFLLSSQQAKGPEVTLTFRDSKEFGGDKKHKTSSTRKPREAKAQARAWKYVIGALSQTKDGPEADATLSMSAAGVVVLSCLRCIRVEGAGTAIGARSVAKLDPAMHSALAWLSVTLDRRFGDPKPGEKETPEQAKARQSRHNAVAYPTTTHWNAYTLLAVERAGILTGCDFFGACEWYPVGARFLLQRLTDVREPLPEEDPPEGDDEEKPDGGQQKGKDAPKEPEKPAPTVVQPKSINGRLVDSDFCLNLLFLKGYIDKAPKKVPGPVVTGRERERDGDGE